jgi:sterol 3beta-glucosyltransferase
MRISIITVGSRGDVQPFAAFGSGLQRAGHEVRICTHADFRELVTGQGLEFAPLAEGALSRGAETEEGRRWAEEQSRWMPTWVGLIRDARSVAHERMREAAAGCRDADVIVATNLTQVLGWQLAREREVPLVRALLNAPSYWMSRRTNRPAATALRQGAWLAARPWLNRVRREALGLGPLPLGEPIGELDRERQLVLYPFSPSVFPKPAGWGDWTEVTGYWFLDARVDHEPPDDLRAFVEAGPPPVCMGFATQLDPDPVATTRMMVEALRGAGRRGVLLRRPEALEGVELRDDVYALERVPHDWLFPRCQAVVHHAGAGTTATVLRTGVPSVTVPHNADQFTWARRMTELRVSPPPIPRRKLSRESLETALIGATTSDVLRERAQALAARILEEDGVAAAVAAFERRFAGARNNGSPARGRPAVLAGVAQRPQKE